MEIKKMDKKGLSMIAGVGFVVSLVVVVLVAVIGARINQGIQDTTTSGTAANNLTINGQDAFINFGSLLPVAGLVGIAALLIGLVLAAFAFRK